MNIHTSDDDTSVSITTHQTKFNSHDVHTTPIVRVRIESTHRSHVLFYTEKDFVKKLQLMALRDSHPTFYGCMQLAEWVLVAWAFWIVLQSWLS